MRQNLCPIDGCPRNVIPTSRYGVCAVHTSQIDCLLWALPKIKFEKPPEPKIAVPGTRQYEKAVFDIAKQAVAKNTK